MQSFTTGDVAATDRFACWQANVTRMFARLNLAAVDETATFEGTARSQRVGQVTMSRFRSSPMDAARLRSHHRADGIDDCFVALQIRGVARAEQYGRTVTLQAGDFTVLDADQPYEIGFRGYPTEHLVVHVARGVIEGAGIDPRLIAARPVRASSLGGRFVAPLLVTAERSAGELTDERRVEFGRLCISHLVTSLRHEVPTSRICGPERHTVRLAEVKTYLLMHLGDPTLNPLRTAVAHGISVRQLHRLFAASDTTFGSWVRDERLRRAREELLDPDVAARPIAAIGAKWGLGGPATFSRLFHRAYGASPREIRRETKTSPSAPCA